MKVTHGERLLALQEMRRYLFLGIFQKSRMRRCVGTNVVALEALARRVGTKGGPSTLFSGMPEVHFEHLTSGIDFCGGVEESYGIVWLPRRTSFALSEGHST